MKNIGAWWLGSLLVVVTIPASTAAQTLADLARDEEHRRAAIATPARVYTNRDLSKPPAEVAVNAPRGAPGGVTSGVFAPVVPGPGANVPPAAPVRLATGPTVSAQAPPSAADGEVFWRERVTRARDELTRNHLLFEALQTRVNVLATEVINRDDPAQRSELARQRERSLSEMERLKKEIQAQERGLTDLEEEARRGNVPPGWLRSR